LIYDWFTEAKTVPAIQHQNNVKLDLPWLIITLQDINKEGPQAASLKLSYLDGKLFRK